MLNCRDQADDLIGCIIIIMFEIINSKQEALHHNYELYSVIPQTLLHAGKSPFFRGVEVKPASHADVLRGSSRVPAGTRNEPLRSSTWEAKVKQERFEKDAPNTFTENKSMSKHRYAIYQVHHLKSKTKIMQLWIGQRSCEFSSIVSQHNKSELQPGGSPLFSKTHFHSTSKQASQQQLDFCNSFQYGK